MHNLISTADVFVENFRDQTLDLLGLSAAALREEHPRLRRRVLQNQLATGVTPKARTRALGVAINCSF
ncbi:CoA transferase [Maritimibacter dapengensis]|uniref:CoA transferase n=1 Tax=Maritimibacter dapengensis TaxID=2836868 RepID=UPI002103E4B2|nr:CoA transferase [Maritimibacter dapengensis]